MRQTILFLLTMVVINAAETTVTISNEVDGGRPDKPLVTAPGDLSDTPIAQHFTIDHILIMQSDALPDDPDMDDLRDQMMRVVENGSFIDRPLEFKDMDRLPYEQQQFMAVLLCEGKAACFYTQFENLPFGVVYVFTGNRMRSVYYDSVFPITIRSQGQAKPAP